MINRQFFFKGYKSILAPDSPAIALGCCFIAIGALLKNLTRTEIGPFNLSNAYTIEQFTERIFSILT